MSGESIQPKRKLYYLVGYKYTIRPAARYIWSTECISYSCHHAFTYTATATKDVESINQRVMLPNVKYFQCNDMCRKLRITGYAKLRITGYATVSDRSLLEAKVDQQHFVSRKNRSLEPTFFVRTTLPTCDGHCVPSKRCGSAPYVRFIHQ